MGPTGHSDNMLWHPLAMPPLLAPDLLWHLLGMPVLLAPVNLAPTGQACSIHIPPLLGAGMPAVVIHCHNRYTAELTMEYLRTERGRGPACITLFPSQQHIMALYPAIISYYTYCACVPIEATTPPPQLPLVWLMEGPKRFHEACIPAWGLPRLA